MNEKQTAFDTPGEPLSFKKKLLEVGSSVTQTFLPLKDISTHLCGFAFYNGEPSRQVELHHYCASINDDVIQCAVYDSPEKGARLIGIEYVVSEKVFNTLPAEEQRLWHSHAYDVKSGSFIAPGLPSAVERALVTDLLTTYGKTWVCWQVDKGDVLPLGVPKLMMVANGKDLDWKPELFEAREQRRGYKIESILDTRKDLEMPKVHPNSDSWKDGTTPQFGLLPTSTSE